MNQSRKESIPMEPMEPMETITVIASLLTIISVCFNIIQWKSKKNLITILRSRSQASFNYFYHIAEHADRIRLVEKEKIEEQKVKPLIKEQAFSIAGFADAARYDIISYSREHLNFIPLREHPARPYTGELPKPIKKNIFAILLNKFCKNTQPLS